VIDGGKALAGCLPFFPASSVTKPLARARRSRAAARAGAVYRGLSPFAEARAITLTFALPVLRQGDLPLFREHQVTLERLLAEAEGWYALFAGFLQKA